MQCRGGESFLQPSYGPWQGLKMKLTGTDSRRKTYRFISYKFYKTQDPKKEFKLSVYAEFGEEWTV